MKVLSGSRIGMFQIDFVDLIDFYFIEKKILPSVRIELTISLSKSQPVLIAPQPLLNIIIEVKVKNVRS